VGAVSGAGTELFRMIRQGRLEWRAEVVAADLRHLKPGVSAIVKAANGSEVTGKVRMIAPTVDPQTRSALVYVDLPPTPAARMHRSRPACSPAASSSWAPRRHDRAAAGHRGARRLQLRVPPQRRQHVSQIKVQPGRRLGDRIEVLGGLNADTQIVVRGAGFLNDGDLVTRRRQRCHRVAAK
jgi:multidrug efflux pump subunit AcrA (membrane-fusion protein)